MDPTVLQRIITGFSQALDPGLATIRPFLLVWISVFILLEGLRTWGALLEDGRRWHHAVGFVLKTLGFAVAYWGWPTIMTTLIEDFVHAGLRFAGSRMTVQQFLDPGTLLAVGIQTAGVLKDITLANAGLFGAVYFLPFLVCWLLYIVAYAIMSCNVFLLQVEVTVILPVTLLALGFIFWGPTRNMAGGVLSYGLNVCFRFFLQAILASIIFRLAPILVPPLPSSTAFALAIEQAVIMVIAALVLAYLFWKLPAVVSQHLAGAPTLSAGGLLQTTAGLVGMATGIAQGAWPRGGAWAVRQPRPPQSPQLEMFPTPRPRLPAPPRVGPPPMPAAQALNSTLRAGAQFLGHDQSGSGPHVSL
jgi:type IV secretion system protein TrbL